MASDEDLNSTSSPPTKRSRGKYTSRACLACRRRKLKCSGDNPCQRCSRHNDRCIFSVSHRRSNSIANGQFNHTTENAIPERGLTVDERLARLEARFDAFATSSRMGESLRASAEPDQEREADFQGDTAFQAPLHTFNTNIEPMRAQLGLQSHESPTSSIQAQNQARSTRVTLSTSTTIQDPTKSIRVGSRTLPFPSISEYDRYIDFFFEDINPCHSCVNEADFRQRSGILLSQKTAGREEVCFLALNYIIFACSDILQHSSSSNERSGLPGWQWFLVADDLVGKRKASGRGDVSLLQFLIYEAFYLVHADKPNAAYNVIGLACRLCFQFGLHQQRLWGEDCGDFTSHIRQRLCWTVYFTDRRIALSCGRPYGMRDSDLQLDHPAWLNDADVKPSSPLPSPDPDHSSIMYLCCMVAFARLAGEVWDQVFAAGVADVSPEIVVVLDARIRHWIETILPTMNLLPSTEASTRRHMRQHCLVVTRFNHLRLLLHRRSMVSLTYDTATGGLCGSLAADIVKQISMHGDEISEPSSFRFHMAVSLGGAILILATLLCRDLTSVGLQSQHSIYVDHYRDAVGMITTLSSHLNAAKRILDDLASIMQVIDSALDRSLLQGSPLLIRDDLDTLFPYGTVDFAQPQDIGHSGPSELSRTGSGTFNFDAFASLDSWDYDLHSSGTGYGVPWI